MTDVRTASAAAQHVVAAICSEDAVPLVELVDDLKLLADVTCSALGHLNAGDVDHALGAPIALYGVDAVLQVRCDVDDDVFVRRCRRCGCTELEACEGGCWWVEPDLCSSCSGEIEIVVDEISTTYTCGLDGVMTAVRLAAGPLCFLGGALIGWRLATGGDR